MTGSGDLSVARVDDALCVRLAGVWSLDRGLPSPAVVERALQRDAGTVRRVVFDAAGLATWDSSLVTSCATTPSRCRAGGRAGPASSACGSPTAGRGPSRRPASNSSSPRRKRWHSSSAPSATERAARRYAALGFRLTTSMSFSWGKGDLFVERIGEHVLGDLIPLRRMLDTGLIVGCGTDWGPKNVFEHLALAETHEFAGSGRRNDGPAQHVTRAEVLLMWTRDAARALGWEGIGTLAPGSHADLIVVDRDPLVCPPADLPRTRVLRTVLGGRTVWDAGAL